MFAIQCSAVGRPLPVLVKQSGAVVKTATPLAAQNIANEAYALAQSGNVSFKVVDILA
jgi:hypothetical protein